MSGENFKQLEYSHLHAAFQYYRDIVLDSANEDPRKPLQQLQQQVLEQGLHGDHALELVKSMWNSWSTEEMDGSTFAAFYRFVFWICRDANKRNLPVHRATSAWLLLLSGRFRLLDHWVSFVRSRPNLLTITEDTWRQVLDFTRSVLEDLSNYDPAGAWPVLLDEFVDHIRQIRQTRRRHSDCMGAEASASASGMANIFGEAMIGVAPSAGSKRRSIDVDNISCQFASLPCAGTNLTSPDQSSLCGAAKRLCLGAMGAGQPEQAGRGAPDGRSPAREQVPGRLGSLSPRRSPPRWRAPSTTSTSGSSAPEQGSASEGSSPTATSTATSGGGWLCQSHSSGHGGRSGLHGEAPEVKSPRRHMSSMQQLLQATVMEGLGLEDL
uniref:Defective in cullin neddylation protein n=2 Tax=Tetraselmis sp. GSL018 TaxID=582737 RepID=A0A061RC16_9CHLO|mmetsp:Transcript_28050/g.66626  ORF Transcript_28050/g.66626 Transcript_28050/m.66626 type:complete len:381 (+) Transcript_28050:456-1598(+)|eukprot:CAMPEP_0177588378 /NCGR_PEP_ID=MMETSP0419_2-20121207/6193_1 /TAXON_ID=582737 /ORGANISM="Tetraselmis sp., Strain GSL018" /LENGTH=380 /DNA_ID=CAMNT_0019078571 /DNA_START=645 /DNA_END=1787 /DNA_ORIENTATION=+